MSVNANIKSFFHEWCNKKGIVPNFETRMTGRKQAPRFISELRMDGYTYSAMGNSTTKKEAETNAARDFVQFLVRIGEVKDADVRGEPPTTAKKNVDTDDGFTKPVQTATGILSSGQYRPVFQPGESPHTIGEAYRPAAGGTYIDIMADRKKLEEAEDVDLNAGIHGNWTVDNCKQRLHQFMQVNRIKADYKYTLVGSATKSFVCELSFFVKQLNRQISARESASNKQSASKSCALSLVRQLYHLGVIEAFSGSFKKAEPSSIEPYNVRVDPILEGEINAVLRELDIAPNPVAAASQSTTGDPVSLVSSKILEQFISSKPQAAGIVSWSPPQENWNPWLNGNIDEGPLASSTLDEISVELANNQRDRLQTDRTLQKLNAERTQLPIASTKGSIMDNIRDNTVTIIRGNTGCGKTTQVCQFILDDYIVSEQGAYCNIIVTQPRRISAISVAERVAQERGETIGNSVGYSVRFDSVLPRPYGGILFCTVGVLLRKLEGGLRGVSHVIVDEIHERDANSDFILIVLRDMVHTYPDLRVILMSATVDTSLFSRYFNDCPVVQLEGSCYPVKEFFLEDVVELLNFNPTTENNKKKKGSNKNADDDDNTGTLDNDENMNLHVSDDYPPIVRQRVARLSEKELNFELIEQLLLHIASLEAKGAVLIFLPGWNVIFILLRYLQRHQLFGSRSYVVLPLHSQLPKEDQRKVFESVPNNVTKIILSTNIAETSITINDVVYVIDIGKAKLKLFTAHNNMTSYVTVWASRSNLQQRKGRAGRVCPGVCYHLMTKARYQKLDEHTTPEIFRIPLHEVALAVKLLRLGAIGQFLSKAIESPPIDAVIEAEVMLRDMQCLDANDELTPLGHILARLPIEPRLGKMMILACIFGVGDALAIIAANASAFSEVFIAERRLTFQQRSFSGSRNSDHLAMLNAFQTWNHVKRRGENAEANFCEYKQLAMPTLRVTYDAKCQLKDLLVRSGFPEDTLMEQRFYFSGTDQNLDAVIALLCTGLYPNVCYHKEKRKVLTMECKSALIHKLSVNCSNYPLNFSSPFFIFGEKVRTKVVSCKQMTMVTPIALLLFGSRKVEYVNDVIRLDGWINLKMDAKTAASIVALRPAVDSLIVRVSKNPESINELTEIDRKVIDLIRRLCDVNAGRYQFDNSAVGLKRRFDERVDPDECVSDDDGNPTKRTSAGPSAFVSY